MFDLVKQTNSIKIVYTEVLRFVLAKNDVWDKYLCYGHFCLFCRKKPRRSRNRLRCCQKLVEQIEMSSTTSKFFEQIRIFRETLGKLSMLYFGLWPNDQTLLVKHLSKKCFVVWQRIATRCLPSRIS